MSDKIEISGFRLFTDFWEINFNFCFFLFNFGDCIILVALTPSVSIIATIGTVSLLLSILIAIASFEIIIFFSDGVILKAKIWSPALSGFSVTITNSPTLSDKVLAIIFPFEITFNSELGTVFPAIRTSPPGFTRIVCKFRIFSLLIFSTFLSSSIRGYASLILLTTGTSIFFSWIFIGW